MNVNVKKCTKCNEEKELAEFSNRKPSKDGKKGMCKVCVAKQGKAWREKNKEEISAKQKVYIEANKDLISKKSKVYRGANKDRIRDRDRQYKANNKEKLLAKNKEYYRDNKEKLLSKFKIYREANRDNKTKRDKERKERDPLYKLTCNTRTLISNSLKRSGWKKKSKSQEILGCDFKTFEKHLNKNPYDFKYGYNDLQLDHIIPLSTAKTEQEILELNHYTNFQLLPSEYNQWVKRDNVWNKGHFENWLSENWSWEW